MGSPTMRSPVERPLVEGMIADIATTGVIRREHVELLRASICIEGVVDSDVAAALLALDRSCAAGQDSAWAPFLADAVADFIVVHAEPEGYVSAANAAWLAQCLAPDGRIETRAAFDVLLRVLALSRWTPVSLALLALSPIYLTVAEGLGPLSRQRAATAAEITPAEVELLRRVLYAFASDGLPAISCAEADVLFAIDALLAYPDAASEWTDFMASVLVNLTKAASGDAIASREVALSPASARGHAETSFILASPAYVRLSPEDRLLMSLERQRVEIITGEELPLPDVEWLAARINMVVAGRPSAVTAAARLAQDGMPLDPRLAAALGMRDLVVVSAAA